MSSREKERTKREKEREREKDRERQKDKERERKIEREKYWEREREKEGDIGGVRAGEKKRDIENIEGVVRGGGWGEIERDRVTDILQRRGWTLDIVICTYQMDGYKLGSLSWYNKCDYFSATATLLCKIWPLCD